MQWLFCGRTKRKWQASSRPARLIMGNRRRPRPHGAVERDHLAQGQVAHQASRRYNSWLAARIRAAASLNAASGAARRSLTAARASSSAATPSRFASASSCAAWAGGNSMATFMLLLYPHLPAPGGRAMNHAGHLTLQPATRAAWTSRNPASLASFYAETAALTVNGGPPSVGRAAIAATARGFMTAFPDMVVKMDEVSQDGAAPSSGGSGPGRTPALAAPESPSGSRGTRSGRLVPTA